MTMPSPSLSSTLLPLGCVFSLFHFLKNGNTLAGLLLIFVELHPCSPVEGGRLGPIRSGSPAVRKKEAEVGGEPLLG